VPLAGRRATTTERVVEPSAIAALRRAGFTCRNNRLGELGGYRHALLKRLLGNPDRCRRFAEQATFG